MTKTLHVSILFTLVLGGLFSPVSADPCLQVEQAVHGIPGRKADDPVVQRLFISSDRLRLDERDPRMGDFFTRCLVQNKDKSLVVYELLHSTKSYQVWDELGNIQEDRDLAERQLIGVLPSDQLENHHLKPGMERVVKAETSEGDVLIVDEKEFQCTHVVVTENGLVVLEAQMTGQVPYGSDYYRFYRRLGVFSDAVLEKLKTIKGFPLAATIRVVTRKPKWYTFTTKVTSLKDVDKPPAFFALPEGWKKEEKPLRVTCYERTCDKTVETANPGGKFRYRGRWVYFCSDACRRRFIAEYKKRWRGEHTASEGGDQKAQQAKKEKPKEKPEQEKK